MGKKHFKSKISIWIGVFLFLIMILWAGFNMKAIYHSVSLKIQWGVTMPLLKEKYKYYESKVQYMIFDCQAEKEKNIVKDLYKQIPPEGWIKQVEGGLKDYKIDSKYYPDFNRIDYCTKKTDSQSFIYLLYSSSTSKLYLYEVID